MKSGLSATDIAKELGISRPTVYRWLRRWEEEGNLKDKPRPEIPRKISREEDQRIRNAVANYPFSHAVGVREELQLNISAEIVRRRLHEMGYRHRTPGKKLKVTDRHRQLRLQFAQQHENVGLYFWGRVFFSNEKKLVYLPWENSLLENEHNVNNVKYLTIARGDCRKW